MLQEYPPPPSERNKTFWRINKANILEDKTQGDVRGQVFLHKTEGIYT